MEQPTERLSETVYMVRHRKTGLWSSGGSRPKWRKRGKIWRKRSDVELHLALGQSEWSRQHYRVHAEVVPCVLLIGERDDHDSATPEQPVPVSLVAQRLGWSSERTLRWLLRIKAATKVGGRWVADLEAVEQHFPVLVTGDADTIPRGELDTRSLPVYLTTGDVAKLLGWPTWKARRWLKREGARVQVAGRWVTTPRLLRAHFPDALDVMVSAAPQITHAT